MPPQIAGLQAPTVESARSELQRSLRENHQLAGPCAGPIAKAEADSSKSPVATRLSTKKAAKPLIDLRPSFRALALIDEGAAAISSVAGVPVTSATTLSFGGAKNDFLHPSALTTIDVRFGAVDEASFDTLRAAFGGKSEVAYDANRSYELIDFLPPAIQALVNQDIELPKEVILPGTESWEALPYDENKSISLTVNCHGTAYESVRAFHQTRDDVSVFMGDMNVMDGVSSSEPFTEVHAIDADNAGQLANLDLEPGDLVQFFDPNGTGATQLLHSAVHVGGGVFFEKPNTETNDEDSPWRLATADSVRMPVEDFVCGPVEVKVFRASEDLEPAAQRFSSEVAEDALKWAESFGRPLGNALVMSMENSLGGGFLGEYPCAAADVALARDASGRGVLSR